MRAASRNPFLINMTNDSGGSSITSIYSVSNDFLSDKIKKNSNDDIKSQIISKIHNTSSFLSGIVSERKNRFEYEDLDKIQDYHQDQSTFLKPKLNAAYNDENNDRQHLIKPSGRALTFENFSLYQNNHYNNDTNNHQNFMKNNRSLPNFNKIDNFTNIKDHFKYKNNCDDSNNCDDNNLSDDPTSSDVIMFSNNNYNDKKKHTRKKSLSPSSGCKKQHNLYLFLYFCFFILFLLLGGFIFHHFEEPLEMRIRQNFYNTRLQFLNKYPEILDDDLEAFLAEVVKANDRGISPLRNASTESNWSFGQALFFSSTVVTTIGYGHVTPLSQTGKIFCMIYATIGIPLTLILLTAVVERLLIPANWLLGSLNAKLGHLYQPFNIRLLHLFIIATIVGILFFGIPTAVFAYLEPAWGILDAFYYCFISMTTVGLGDYIPDEGVSPENRSIYKICITVYLITGLIAMMLVLTIFYDIPQLNLGQLFTENSTGETEKLRLSGNSAPCYSGPSGLYIPQHDEDIRRVRIRPHGDESPSPEEQQPPSLHRDMRVP